VNVAFEALDSIGVVNNHFHPHDVWVDAEKYGAMQRDKPEYNTVAGFAQWMMDLYYSFLNCGFRIPVSAGSASGVMPSWIGYERVYVRLSGAFSYEQWFRDLKAGRSIATNGPLLRVEVNGKPPGAEFEWTGATQARVSFEISSREPLDRIEVVFNGSVMVSAKGPNASLTVPIPEPGWLAVRCFGPAGETIRYAHSSPFYFPKNGKMPVKKADAERWADYIHKLAAEANRADYPSQEAYDKAQTTFREAESVYRNRIE
jgi:TolB protein